MKLCLALIVCIGLVEVTSAETVVLNDSNVVDLLPIVCTDYSSGDFASIEEIGVSYVKCGKSDKYARSSKYSLRDSTHSL